MKRYVRKLKVRAAESAAATGDRVPRMGRWRRRSAICCGTPSLYALPSHHENFGVSLAEALARGVPAIVSSHVLISDDLAAANAAWVTPNDRQSLATTLLHAMTNDEARAGEVSRGQAVRARSRLAPRRVAAARRLRVASDRGASADGCTLRSPPHRRPGGSDVCGIAGGLFFHPRFTADVRRDIGQRLLAAIRHRGPDGEGVWGEPIGRRRRPTIQPRFSSTVGSRSSTRRAPGRSR